MTTKLRLGYTHAGLPRPRLNGLPIPWNSDAFHLGLRHRRRTLRTAGGTICQVCGEKITDTAVAFGTVDPTGQVTPTPGEPIPDGWGVHAMDHGLLHRTPCARMALRNCPALREMRTDGRLIAVLTPPGSIEVWGDDGVFVALEDL